MTKCLAEGHTYHGPSWDLNPQLVKVSTRSQVHAPDHWTTGLHYFPLALFITLLQRLNLHETLAYTFVLTFCVPC